jgi:hypothetical protein
LFPFVDLLVVTTKLSSLRVVCGVLIRQSMGLIATKGLLTFEQLVLADLKCISSAI